MASSKTKTDTKNTLQETLEQEKAKIPSKYEYNKVLFTWESNDRPVYQFSGGQKTAFTGLIVLFGLYFIWIGQPILTLVAAAVFFILFIFVSIPPQRATHQIEKVGIRTMEVLYTWEDMTSFWMTEKDGVIMLYIDTRLNFPPRLIFIIESFEEAAQIANMLVQKIEYRYLVDKQSNFEKMLDGNYIDPTIFYGEEKEITVPTEKK